MTRKVGSQRLTYLQRILGVYPFLYTLGYRANRHWLDRAIARDRGAFALTYPEGIGLTLMAGRLGWLTRFNIIVVVIVALLCFWLLDRVNRHILVDKGLGVRFENRFDHLAGADKVWLSAYSAFFVAACFAPLIGAHFPLTSV